MAVKSFIGSLYCSFGHFVIPTSTCLVPFLEKVTSLNGWRGMDATSRLTSSTIGLEHSWIGGSLLTSLFTFLLICFACRRNHDRYKLKEVKELVKLNTCWNIWLFLSNIQGEIVFQKLQNLSVAKVLMSSYILCEILSFQARVAQRVFHTSGSYSLAELIILSPFQYSELIYL